MFQVLNNQLTNKLLEPNPFLCKNYVYEVSAYELTNTLVRAVSKIAKLAHLTTSFHLFICLSIHACMHSATIY